MKIIIRELALEGLEISGDTYNFRCPICGDSKKDKNKKRGYFYWKPDKNYYSFKCHNCNEAHTLIGYLKLYEKDMYRKYIYNALKSGGKLKVRATQNSIVPNIVSKIDNSAVKSLISDLLKRKDIIPAKNIKEYEVQKYIFDRGIPKNKLKHLFYSDNFYDKLYKPLKILLGQFDKNESSKGVSNDKRIFWFIKDRTNNIIGIQGRSVEKDANRRYLTVKIVASSVMLGNLENVSLTDRIFVTEGFIDSLFLPNAVSLNGSSYAGAISKLKDLNAKDVTVVFDNEPHNKEIRKKVSGLIDNLISNHITNFGICLLPKNIRNKGKDINDYIKNGIEISKLINIINASTYYGAIAKIKLLRW